MTVSLRRIGARAAVAWRRAARHPVAATSALVLFSFAAWLTIVAMAGVREPVFHDELSQLVMADIFAHGRLCETPHLFWPHFETFHVLSQPCYQGKYPPAPALLMAAGQVVTGRPIAGVFLSVALMICATAYAMYAWLPGRWALLGTTLVTLRFAIVGDWVHEYWGSGVAAAGGALVLGATAGLTREARAGSAGLFGVGLVLLATSRPYEGAALGLAATAFVAWQFVRVWPGRRPIGRALLSAGAALVLGLGWLAYYNWRVTGSPATFPYTAYEITYSAAPIFVWQDPREPAPVLRHREMAVFERNFSLVRTRQSSERWPRRKLVDLAAAVWTYWKPSLVFALAGLLLKRPGGGPADVVAAWLAAAVLLASAVASWSAPRYIAPATASLFLLATTGLFRLSRGSFGRRRGRTFAALIVLAFAAALPAAIVRQAVDARASKDWWAVKRDIRSRLLQMPGDDLVFVRYGPAHSPHFEWVYNGAAIDRQPIVWAREIDAAADARLRAYFRQRRSWVVLADATPPELVEWPAGF